MKKPITYEYTIESRQVSQGGTIPTEDCNAIIFTNKGTSTAYINKRPIPTDESYSVFGLSGEIDKTIWVAQFDNTGTNLLYVDIKKYL